jgi:hypothetical protein
MVTNCVDVEFVNFEPAQRERNTITTILQKLHELAPSDAVIKVIVHNGLGMMKATVNIGSAAGSFIASAVEADPIEAIREVYKSMTSKLDIWKMRRFADLEDEPG